MTSIRIPARAAAALFLERQRLSRPRGQRLTSASLERFVAGVGGLQIDSVNVVDRAHHLTLWSRFGEYDRATFERLAYRKRVLFEYLSHVACFVATRDMPLWRGCMAEIPHRRRRDSSWIDDERVLIDSVESAIAERGPLGNADFERPKAMGKGGGWWTWKPAMHALDYLWKSGRIAVHSRAHFQKRYAVMERVLPQAAAVAALPYSDFTRHRVLRSLEAMGAAAFDDLRMYWTWPQLKVPDLRATLHGLIGEGLVQEVQVDGQSRVWFSRTEDLAALKRAAGVRRPSHGTTFLSPFDSFLWHRERALRLWDYFYRIEIYVPGHKRTHGYYSLPVLHEGQLIGRVDPKTHRERGVLELRHVHLEPWFGRDDSPPHAHWGTIDRDAALAGIADSAKSLARHVGCSQVTLTRVTPTALKAPLARLLRDA
ncbi:MAG: crosslink repair DNA glycosylase YcaQ family protein [Candidatus Eisenbacteria bacterium]